MRRVTYGDTRRAQLESIYIALQEWIDERKIQPTASQVGAMVNRPAWKVFISLVEMSQRGWIKRSRGRIELRGIK